METPLNRLRERLTFPRDLLTLLNETQLFGPMVEMAIKDIDDAIESLESEQKGD